MSYRYILFDLDGTITDSSEGIIKCVKYALEAAGKDIYSQETLQEFIGPPLVQAFQEIAGMTQEEAVQATAKFRERYNVTGVYENKPYPGIEKVLDKLHKAGYILAVATSKPQHLADTVLNHFGLAEFFDIITGSTLDGSRSTKSEVIIETLRLLGVPEDDKKNVIMVGDRKYDMAGASSCGIDSLGVYYGFAKDGELEDAGATYVVNEVDDIVSKEPFCL